MSKPTVSFDDPPVIGEKYKLIGAIGDRAGETEFATLVNLIPHDEMLTMPGSGRRETYHNVHAIFETEDGHKFKRVVLPELE